LRWDFSFICKRGSDLPLIQKKEEKGLRKKRKREEKFKHTLDLYLKQLITWNNERRKREKDSFIFYKYELKKKQKTKNINWVE